MRKFETTVIDTAEEYIQELVSCPGWNRTPCYRGLPNAEWQILPSLFRENLGKTEFSRWAQMEAAIMLRFKQRSISELGYEPHSELEWHAVGQFFGLPTQFSTWSQNGLVGLWYATEPTPGETDGAVWRLVPGEPGQTIANDFEQLPETPRLYVPQRRGGAMLSQRCVFLSHPLPEFDTAPIPFEDYYECGDERWHLCQILIPHYAKADLRERLATMGVDSYSMRPGAEGLAAQIREETYHHTDAFEWAFES